MRILAGVPSSERIIHDIMKVVGSMALVQAKSGVLVQGVGNRNMGGVMSLSDLRQSPKTHQARERAVRLIVGANGPTQMRRKCWLGSWRIPGAFPVAGTKVKEELKWSKKQASVEFAQEE
jgi:hypothetical protein